MSNKTNAMAGGECARLREFKDFLRKQTTSDSGTAGADADLMRNCIARSSTETYRLNSEERQAELIHLVWTQLLTKGCPQHFQIKLMHSIVTLLEQELRNVKECVVNLDGENLDSQYDLLKLQKFVCNHLEILLSKLTDNTSADQLELYADDAALCTAAASKSCQCANLSKSEIYTAAQIKNKPRKMEDRHVCLPRYSEIYQLTPGYSYYAVFDGHSGVLSATYVCAQLSQLLAKQLLRGASDSPEDPCDFYREAFEYAFLQADERFAQKRLSSGTTAVCTLLQQTSQRKHLYIAWVGDSKALLVGPKTRLQLVKAHKPDSPDERRRIEAAGGSVIHAQGQWRVNGILNVARSIGDYYVEAVIAEPDFVDVKLTAAHDFLVLGTDGLWDHVTEASVSDIVYNALADASQKFEDIPKLLIEAAKSGDSQDNITVVVVLLKLRAQIAANWKQS